MELAVRIHYSKGSSDISAAAKAKLRFTSGVIIAILTLVLLAWGTVVIISARKPGNYGYAFYDNWCSVYYSLGWCFLCQAIVMLLLVIWLFVETQRAINREK